ncbi:hypothetical protein SAMN06295967_10671 [Belliella buryatensis]|uniref:Uncharacterized protein n=1 Tax=Belliella buryatensis TaxID=1500549 RepID=A0A239D187_9BACT|nr:hypothetical protein SAMN06295967_10671 [Belliella buryatensis]
MYAKVTAIVCMNHKFLPPKNLEPQNPTDETNIKIISDSYISQNYPIFKFLE